MNETIASPDMIPAMAITTRSSTKVNPRLEASFIKLFSASRFLASNLP